MVMPSCGLWAVSSDDARLFVSKYSVSALVVGARSLFFFTVGRLV